MGLADRLVMEKEEKHPRGLQVSGVSKDKDVVAVSGARGDCGKRRICRKVSEAQF